MKGGWGVGGVGGGATRLKQNAWSSALIACRARFRVRLSHWRGWDGGEAGRVGPFFYSSLSVFADV